MNRSQEPNSQPWHLPVLPNEVLEGWHSKEGGVYVDGTVGGGGHSSLLLKKDPHAQLIAIDKDPESIRKSQETLKEFTDRVLFCLGSYCELPSFLEQHKIPEVDGVLLDLGVNSHQLDERNRGFSFREDGPLDMRFNQQSDGLTAADIVNTFSEEDIANIFYKWGEIHYSRKLAKAIVQQRSIQKWETTFQLIDCIRKNSPNKRKIDPSTLPFQALRIEVNQELQELDLFLDRVLPCLAPQGRLAIISFHSLEDRRIKQIFRHWQSECICPPKLPICQCNKKKEVEILTRKPIKATEEEQKTNPRSRSAMFRVCEKK